MAVPIPRFSPSRILVALLSLGIAVSGCGADDEGAPVAIGVTGDAGRLAVEIPATWQWNGAASALRVPFIGASSGPPGDEALDSPLLQIFVADTTRGLPDVLGVLLGDFGFDTACSPPPTQGAYTVGTIDGLRAVGEACGPNGFRMAAFVGDIDSSTEEVVVFMMTSEPDSDPSPEMILETLRVD